MAKTGQEMLEEMQTQLFSPEEQPAPKKKKKSLAELFKEVAQPNADGYSRWVTIEELVVLDDRFRTGNGGSWCRSDGPLGREFHVRKRYAKGNSGSIVAVRLDGLNNTPKERPIAAWILKAIRKERCVVLDVGTQIECDHKNGKYDNRKVADVAQQELEDFQPLSKAVNVAKRQHCKDCQESGKRFDARRLGYSAPFIQGDEDSKNCAGCYWHDPKRFNQVISQGFIPEF